MSRGVRHVPHLVREPVEPMIAPRDPGRTAVTPRTDSPPEVRTAFVLWLAAIAASVLANLLGLLVFDEVLAAALAQSGAETPPEAVAAARGIAYALLVGVVLATVAVGLFLATRMRGGANWARIVLTVIGAVYVVFGVVGLLGGPRTPGGVVGVLIAVLGAVEMLLILAAIWFMFRPRASAWFA